jgi:formylglycine-generating enzyme required for sulfatase activity
MNTAIAVFGYPQPLLAPHPVQSTQTNEFGLFDAWGNVHEICYPRKNAPTAIVARGGSWFDTSMRPSFTGKDPTIHPLSQEDSNPQTGFRVVLVPAN